jgi:hypothetical protein
MIKALMNVSKENRNTRCYSLPPLKEISPEIYERRGKAQEMMKGALIAEKGGYLDNWKEEYFSFSHATFPFMRR